MLVEFAADQDDFGRRVMLQFACDRWAVGNDGEGKIPGEVAGDFRIRCAAIEEHGLSRPNHPRRIGAELTLHLRRHVLPRREIR